MLTFTISEDSEWHFSATPGILVVMVKGSMIGLLSIIVLGFLLGMRHATDPDHVIAVSTIVSRRRSVKQAAMIGGVWGIGHALTILLVGGGIILVGWVIPTRIGLSMEFSVGLMLILLGILNQRRSARRAALGQKIVQAAPGIVRCLRRGSEMSLGQIESDPLIHVAMTDGSGLVHRQELTPVSAARFAKYNDLFSSFVPGCNSF